MGRAAVDQLLFLMDEAFDGNGEHSLMANLRTVTDDDWLWLPPGGQRSIRQIVSHVAACKYMYDNHAFGDARMTWDDPVTPAGRERLPCTWNEIEVAGSLPSGEPPMTDIIEWLRDGHRLLREHVAALDDDELLRPRRTNWGELAETRWIIAVMIEHDLYHAGEINHVRSLRQGNDRWAWESS